MSDSTNNEQHQQLLTAYFDNELDAEDRTRVESSLVDNPGDAKLLQQWRENGDAIRKLPRYCLGDDFSERVLAATESVSSHPIAIGNVTRVEDFVDVESTTNNWRIGLSAIATLAAMLLLTLFVFPAMVGSNLADNQPARPVSNEVVNPDHAANNDALVGNHSPEKRRPELGSLNSSLPSESRNGRPVDPIALKTFTGPSVEQVLWIENRSLADLESILSDHSIKIVDAEGGILNQVHLVPQSSEGVEAVFVVSTVARMRRAIADLSSESTGSVRAFPLPGGSTSSAVMPRQKPGVGNASAQQIKPLDLSQKSADATEIASVDKWFGLVGDDDDSRIVPFLLLLNPAPDSGSSDSIE